MWRNSGLGIRFYWIDGRASLAIIILLYKPGITTLFLFILFFAFLASLEYMGYDLPNAFRKLRILLTGKFKRNIPEGIK